MMIVNVESSEATVVEMNLSERALKQWIDEPKEKAEGESDTSSRGFLRAIIRRRSTNLLTSAPRRG